MLTNHTNRLKSGFAEGSFFRIPILYTISDKPNIFHKMTNEIVSLKKILFMRAQSVCFLSIHILKVEILIFTLGHLFILNLWCMNIISTLLPNFKASCKDIFKRNYFWNELFLTLESRKAFDYHLKICPNQNVVRPWFVRNIYYSKLVAVGCKIVLCK